METIKSTFEYTSCIVSADGTMHRYLSATSTEDDIAKAKQDIADYEKTSAGVLFSRLMQRGVLTEIDSFRVKDGEELTKEQQLHNDAVMLLDAVMDDGCCRANYYLFTPKTEEDIKDLYVYHKLTYQYSDLTFREEPDELKRVTHTCKVGETYIYESNADCEYGCLISPEALAKSVAKMADVFEKLGKAQRKAN